MSSRKWTWFGVNIDKTKFQTYDEVEYKEHPINRMFKDIETLADIKKNLKFLCQTIYSPTSSYFNVDENTKIFYRDQQDCILWAFDEETGYVYVYDYEDITTRQYCAKSLAEFISHIYDDALDWFEQKGYVYPPSIGIGLCSGKDEWTDSDSSIDSEDEL